MPKPKFTSGDWSTPHIACKDTTCDCRYVLSDHLMGSICTISVDNGIKFFASEGIGPNDSPPLDEAIANAHLISSAPELFYALEELTELLSDTVGSISVNLAVSRAKRALAKATGFFQKIKTYKPIQIPSEVIDYAKTIQLENYKVNSPKKFQKHAPQLAGAQTILEALSDQISVGVPIMDYVYFSASNGAEPHEDLLDAKKVYNDTYIIPIILPPGASIITAEDDSCTIEVGGIYQFDHTKTHSLVHEVNGEGCVLMMIAIKR